MGTVEIFIFFSEGDIMKSKRISTWIILISLFTSLTTATALGKYGFIGALWDNMSLCLQNVDGRDVDVLLAELNNLERNLTRLGGNDSLSTRILLLREKASSLRGGGSSGGGYPVNNEITGVAADIYTLEDLELRLRELEDIDGFLEETRIAICKKILGDIRGCIDFEDIADGFWPEIMRGIPVLAYLEHPKKGYYDKFDIFADHVASEVGIGEFETYPKGERWKYIIDVLPYMQQRVINAVLELEILMTLFDAAEPDERVVYVTQENYQLRGAAVPREMFFRMLHFIENTIDEARGNQDDTYLNNLVARHAALVERLVNNDVRAAVNYRVENQRAGTTDNLRVAEAMLGALEVFVMVTEDEDNIAEGYNDSPFRFGTNSRKHLLNNKELWPKKMFGRTWPAGFGRNGQWALMFGGGRRELQPIDNEEEEVLILNPTLPRAFYTRLVEMREMYAAIIAWGYHRTVGATGGMTILRGIWHDHARMRGALRMALHPETATDNAIVHHLVEAEEVVENVDGEAEAENIHPTAAVGQERILAREPAGDAVRLVGPKKTQ